MRNRATDLLLAVSIFAVMVVSITATVDSGAVSVAGEGLGSSCWVNSVFGILCPYCGMTRSFIALGHGDLLLSLSHHPGGILLFGLALWIFGAVVISALRRLPPLSSRSFFLPVVQTVALTCVVIGVFRSLVL